jgi:hypothetical protein
MKKIVWTVCTFIAVAGFIYLAVWFCGQLDNPEAIKAAIWNKKGGILLLIVGGSALISDILTTRKESASRQQELVEAIHDGRDLKDI